MRRGLNGVGPNLYRKDEDVCQPAKAQEGEQASWVCELGKSAIESGKGCWRKRSQLA